ncbi:MAG: hypothetical protein AAGA03_12245 [Planctomycetota bacterium]
MNIPPTAVTSAVAGTARAAAKGGEADKQATESGNRLATNEKPAGKDDGINQLDAGHETADRDGDGRQLYDRFTPSSESEDETSEESQPPPHATRLPSDGHQLDFEA